MTETDSGTEPPAPPKNTTKGPSGGGSGGSRKFIAIIVALLMVIVALSYLDLSHNISSASGPNASVSTTQQYIDTGQQFNLTINAKAKFSYAHVYFGDNSVTNYTYNGKAKFNVTHVYNSPGNYFVFYKLFNGKSVYSSFNQLVQVSVASKVATQSPYSSYGYVNLIDSSTNGTVGNNTLVYNPGTNLSFAVGYAQEPSNSSYQVVYQKININGPFSASDSIGYDYNYVNQLYQIPQQSSVFNISDLTTGYYQLSIRTMTANLTTTNVSGTFMHLGAINSSMKEYNTTYYEDIVISSNAGLYSKSSAAGAFLNAEVVNGVDNNMDFALQDTVNGQEVVDQVIQYLVAFNGSSDTSFMPELAKQLPTISNGGINSNYANYTQKTPWGTTYKTHIKPYENYTFKIRGNATYTNGAPVTAWDFLYSMARTIMLEDSSNAQGGYLSEFLLPGNYANSNTFYNITQNITINNASNSITFHFQKPESTAVVYQLLATDGSEAESANWYAAHGAGLTWSPAGFQAYKKYGNPANYNTYIVNHLMSDGPYKLAYMVPGSKVVLVANPSFVSPGPWDPAPKIGQITIEYIGSEPSAYLLMKSGAAQAAALPSANWNEVQSLQAAGKVKVYHFNELSFRFFEFNANINETAVKGYSGNLPQTLFMNQNIRKAFAYSFNYNEYINYQVGNKVFNTTFQIPYAGYLPVGAQYYESMNALNKSGSPVPYYNMNTAHQYMNNFINGTGADSAGAMKVTMTSAGVAMYNGAQLTVPIFIPTAHPALQAAVSTWAKSLAELGIKVSEQPIAEDTIFLQEQGNNFMPVAWGGWFSSFAFPNRIASIGLPTNQTSYLGAGDVTPYWFSGAGGNSPTSNSTQVSNMNLAIQDFNKALANGTNPTVAKMWYWKANGLLINASYYVFIGQGVGYWVLSTQLNNQGILNYELNPFEAGVNRLMYAGLSYNATT